MKAPENNLSEENRCYYIDEAGCLTLFDKYGKVIIGEEGVSKVFMLGVAWVQDVTALEEGLKALRAELIQDPYFSQVPSMKSTAKKTVLAFHAKDDIAEVRWQVFKYLQTVPCKVIVAFRRKMLIAQKAKAYKSRTGQRYPTHQVYDDLASRVMMSMLHKADCQVIFSRRGKTSRQNALLEAVEQAKQKFEIKRGIVNTRNINVQVAAPHEFAGLQLIDYYLWALQRLLERNEDRYFNFLRDNYRLIMDLDDKSSNGYGTWYQSSKPLTLEIMKPI